MRNDSDPLLALFEAACLPGEKDVHGELSCMKGCCHGTHAAQQGRLPTGGHIW